LTPLQVNPQRFSSMQALQIRKPQGQVQQNGCASPHTVHK